MNDVKVCAKRIVYIFVYKGDERELSSIRHLITIVLSHWFQNPHIHSFSYRFLSAQNLMSM